MSLTRLAAILPVEHWWRALAMPTADVPSLVFADVALPRIAVSLIVGAALALAGVLLQQALRNPLADTTTLGVASGAYLALAATTLFAPAWLDAGQTWIALAGGGVAAALVLAISRAAGFAPAVLILAGLTVSLVSGAAGAALTILNHDYLSTLFIWQAGSLVQNGWSNILDVLPRLALCAIAAALLLRPLAAFDLEDGQAQALGIPVGMLRGAAVVLAVALGAFSVSTVGVIGFVGVAAGNLVRALGARTLLQRLVWAPLTGALLLWSTDELVQRLTPFLGAIPTGSVAAVLGAPLLVLMIARQRNAASPPVGTFAGPIGRTRYPRTVISVILVACLVMMSIALFFGKDATGWRWLAMDGVSAVLPWRGPRVAAAAAAGALLAVAGTLMQRLTGNPMASPEVLGVSSGAALGIVLLLIAVPEFTRSQMAIAATTGATVTLAAVLALNQRSDFAPERLLLTGIGFATAFTAFAAVLLARGDPRSAVLLAWMSGSTYRVTSADAQMACGVLVVILALAPWTGRWLAILPLGGGVARALGLALLASRLAILMLAAASAAMATLTVGPLSFAGLLVPHTVRGLGIVRPRDQLLAAAGLGACLMTAADWLGRTIAFPWQIPAGLLASLIGGPFLVLLLRRRR
jgi:iron complex transport system permease protein